MIKKLGIFILFFTSSAFAQVDVTLSDPLLSFKYARGAHLIFDCVDKHWVCAAKGEYVRCQKARDFEVLERKDKLSCVPIKLFNSEKECNKSQGKLISRAVAMRFCESSEIQKATRLGPKD